MTNSNNDGGEDDDESMNEFEHRRNDACTVFMSLGL